MNSEETPLIVELYQSIESVLSALDRTTKQKRLLKKSTVEAKNQIQDDVSIHLELLRNREVWLQEQVDIHAQMKEETFESHLRELYILLAKLQVYEELLEAPELAECGVIAAQAKEIFARVNNELLHLEEASEVSFNADNFTLSDAVKSFGKIVEGKPTEPPQKTSFKKVGSKEVSHELVFIREHFKHVLSSPRNDWLINGIEAKEVSSDLGKVWEYFEEVKKSDSRQWLYQKHQPMDLETMSNHFNIHFQEVKATPAADWLQSGVAPGDNEDPPRHITSDTSDNIKSWLLKPVDSLSFSSKDDGLVDEGISLVRHYSVDEKSAEYRQKCDTQLIDRDRARDDWLLTSTPQVTQSTPQVTQTGSWLQRFRESTGASTSDWLIVSESEPDYCEWLTQDSIDRCKSCPGESACAKNTFSVFKSVLNSSKSEWLSTATDW